MKPSAGRKLQAMMWPVSVLALLSIVPTGANAEGVFLEPSAGLAIPGGDVGEAFGTGFGLGGALGYNVSHQFALVGRGAFSLHGASDELDGVIDDGGSFSIGAGGRFYVSPPKEGSATAFVGGELGRLGVGWNYTPEAEFVLGDDSDGIGAWYLGFEGGLGYYLSDTILMSGVARVELPSWDDETNEGIDAGDFEGNMVRLEARLTINL